MTTWMKKVFSAEGVTESPPGPHLDRLRKVYQSDGAVYLCLDVSYSMGVDLPAAITGARRFLQEAVTGGYRVGLILWSHRVVAATELSRELDDVEAMLLQAEANGGTQAAPALRHASTRLQMDDASDQVIAVFGDGDLGDEEGAANAADDATRLGIRILTMGLGHRSSQALSVIATDSSAVMDAASSKTLTEDIGRMSTGLKNMRMRGRQ